MQQSILERYPDADLRVYTVWLPVLATDERFAVADLMVDPRVQHFWDEGRVVGDALQRAAGGPVGGVVYDVVAAFGPEATWEAEPPAPLAYGAPVVAAEAEILQALDPYLR